MTPRYEVLSHTADTGIVAHGDTLREAFANAAFAMFDLMFEIDDLVGEAWVRIEVAAPTVEDLLVDWLSALLFEAEIGELALCSFEIETMEPSRVAGWAMGIPLTGLELSGPPIKAVTYHDLRVDEMPAGWSVQVVFDV